MRKTDLKLLQKGEASMEKSKGDDSGCMCGGKERGKKNEDKWHVLSQTHGEAVRLFAMAASQGATDEDIAATLRQGLAVYLRGNVAKEPDIEGSSRTENRKHNAGQKKWTGTTNTTTQGSALAADLRELRQAAVPLSLLLRIRPDSTLEGKHKVPCLGRCSSGRRLPRAVERPEQTTSFMHGNSLDPTFYDDTDDVGSSEYDRSAGAIPTADSLQFQPQWDQSTRNTGRLVEETENIGGGDIARKSRTLFHSLTGETEHNGSRGPLVRFDVEKGQWIVTITIRHKRKVLAVNPALARIFMATVHSLSGNGPQFISDFWKELFQILKTDTRLIINPASTPLGLDIISLCHADAARPNPYKVGDSVLLSSRYLKLKLPCRAEISCPRSVLPTQPAQPGNVRQCLCRKLGLPTYVGPFTITHLRGNHAVNLKGPFRLVNPCVNIKSLRPYLKISECGLLQRTENIGPPRPLDLVPHCVEVTEIMSHTGKPGPSCRCLVRWTREELDTRHDSWVRRRDVSLPAIVAYERLLTENAHSHALSTVKGYSPKGTKKKIEKGAAEWLLKRFIGNNGEFSVLRSQEQTVVSQGTAPALTVQQNGKASIITIDDRKAVISDLANNFKRMFNASREFMSNLKRELSNRSKKKLVILLVDMDQVPNFYQKASVETISKLPMPIFVVGSSNRKVDSSVLASKGNFHFTLAQKNKDSADAVITMAATTLQNLLVAYGRQDDVHFATISDDRIFETVTHTLRQGGAFATNISRQDAARGLKGISRMLTSPSSGMENENNTSVTTLDSERVCMECGKTFRSAKHLCWHLMQIRELQSSLIAHASLAATYNTKPESEAAVKV